MESHPSCYATLSPSFEQIQEEWCRRYSLTCSLSAPNLDPFGCRICYDWLNQP